MALVKTVQHNHTSYLFSLQGKVLAQSPTLPCTSLPTDTGSVTLGTTVTETGTYTVWTRMMVPSTTSTSYWLKIGNNCGISVGGGTSIPANTWTWVNFKDGNTTSKISVNLTAGTPYVITLIGKDAGVKVDKLLVTNNLTCTPSGTGDGTCVLPSNTPIPTTIPPTLTPTPLVPTVTPTRTPTPLPPTPTRTPTPTQAVPPTATPTSAPVTSLRVEAGSTANFTDTAGNVWKADIGYFSDGSSLDRGTITITNTQNPRIYQTERYNMTIFKAPMINGNYLVNLHFAETCCPPTKTNTVGSRVFNFNVEGIQVNNFDVMTEAGSFATALIKSYPVTVSDGEMTITFSAIAGKDVPEINGIEIVPNTVTLSPTQPSVPGDINKDGRADLLDFNIWRDEFLGNVTTKQADLNADGRVDLLDYNIWLTAYKNN